MRVALQHLPLPAVVPGRPWLVTGTPDAITRDTQEARKGMIVTSILKPNKSQLASFWTQKLSF
jgi:hypothetical protein